MSAVQKAPLATNVDEASNRIQYLQKLQVVSNKIHSTSNVDEIMLDLAEDICDLFNCERMTLYALSIDKSAIVSKVKTGLRSSSDLRLPISGQSIAGYVALSRRVVNIADVYLESELRRYSPDMNFLSEVDRRSGYRTREMLVAPMLDKANGEIVGVVQLINSRSGAPFDRLAEECIKDLCATLAIAVTQRQAIPALRSKYDALVSEAVISRTDFERATRTARESGSALEDILIDDYHVRPELVGKALSKYFGVPYQPFMPGCIRRAGLPKDLKRNYFEPNLWLPIRATDDGLSVVAVDPEQVKSARVIASIFPRTRIEYQVTTQREFTRLVDSFFNGSSGIDPGLDLLPKVPDAEIEPDAPEATGQALPSGVENEVVRLVNKIITDAHHQGASDIHIEPRPGKEKTTIRFRKDGTLERYMEVPASLRSPLLARVKIMCDLDISERRRPQDGKIKFSKFGPADIELRVATIPSSGGVEDVVLRILRADKPIPLGKLDLLPKNLTRLKEIISKPHGLFLVCGPTGSGKTTTLHSVLNHLDHPGTKIWTVEDPVEITQGGLRQVQVNRKAGLDFSTVMRAFLRADPDIIMIGEMRDNETASIGLESSLTGHLVLATLHTNSAPESIVRLLQMGIDRFNLADALLGILAQRLARRLCSDCKRPYLAGEDEMRELLGDYCLELQDTSTFQQDRAASERAVMNSWLTRHASSDGRFTLYRAVGCHVCGTGYKGQIGLHELMYATDEVKKLIHTQARAADILAAVVEGGMTTLKMDGIEKVLSGITDMKQVRAVCIK